MKKTSVIIICLSLMFCLGACGNNTDNDDSSTIETIESDCKEYSNQEFANFDIELTGGTLTIVVGEKLSLVYDDGEAVNYTISDDTLYISQQDFNDMVLTIPSDDSYDVMTIFIKRGKLIMEETLNVNQISLDVDNGEVSLENLFVNKSFDTNVNQGSIYLYGTLTNIDAKCNEGHIQINTSYKQDDYNYELTISNAHIIIGDDYHEETNYTIDNEASYMMNLSSTSGDITVEFEK
ncbi:MAG: DUF4097 domain-containing protein [Erysipelotrichaceae bacterium]|nr:DUF4097 domain-containing protein [Erysipelotrichaceae bacterium]